MRVYDNFFVRKIDKFEKIVENFRRFSVWKQHRGGGRKGAQNDGFWKYLRNTVKKQKKKVILAPGRTNP